MQNVIASQLPQSKLKLVQNVEEQNCLIVFVKPVELTKALKLSIHLKKPLRNKNKDAIRNNESHSNLRTYFSSPFGKGGLREGDLKDYLN